MTAVGGWVVRKAKQYAFRWRGMRTAALRSAKVWAAKENHGKDNGLSPHTLTSLSR
jgi:hypothetical protein